MEASFFQRHPRLNDFINFIIFVVCVVAGTILINTYVFRSFNVSGHSMENTLQDGDRLIVNRLPVTAAAIQNKEYIPERGQIIVFQNPRYADGLKDEYLVKRVIALPGERVSVHDGTVTVYNAEHPNGYVYDNDFRTNHSGPQSPSSGDQDITVPKDTIYVAGDNRIGGNSYDSRIGLGTIPLFKVVGPVGMRIFPFNKIGTY